MKVNSTEDQSLNFGNKCMPINDMKSLVKLYPRFQNESLLNNLIWQRLQFRHKM